MSLITLKLPPEAVRHQTAAGQGGRSRAGSLAGLSDDESDGGDMAPQASWRSAATLLEHVAALEEDDDESEDEASALPHKFSFSARADRREANSVRRRRNSITSADWPSERSLRQSAFGAATAPLPDEPVAPGRRGRLSRQDFVKYRLTEDATRSPGRFGTSAASTWHPGQVCQIAKDGSVAVSARRGVDKLDSAVTAQKVQKKGEPWNLGQVCRKNVHGSVTLPPRGQRHAGGKPLSEVETVWLTLEQQAQLVRAQTKRPARNQDWLHRLLVEITCATPCPCERANPQEDSPSASCGMARKVVRKEMQGTTRCCSPVDGEFMCRHCTGDCDCQWVQPIMELLRRGLDVNGMTYKGETPLLVAARAGQTRVAVLLLAKQANPILSEDQHGWTPLHEAARLGRLAISKVLVEGALAIDEQWGLQPDAESPLANPEADMDGPTPRMAFRTVSATSRHGATPLSEAAAGGHVDIVKLLLAHGAMVNVKMQDKTTALMKAALRGSTEVCRLLLQAKAYVCSGCSRGANKVSDGPCAGRCTVPYHMPLRNKMGDSALAIARRAYGHARLDGKSSGCQDTSDTVQLLQEFGVK